MRIPWYLSSSLCFIALMAALYFGSSQRNFTEAPSKKKVDSALAAWKAKQSFIQVSELSESTQNQLKAAKLLSKKIAAEKSTLTSTFDPKSVVIETATTLDQFKKLPLKTTDLFSIANYYSKKNKHANAHLALERIIDSSADANVEQIKIAARKIFELPADLSLWNPDPSMRQTLTVYLKIDRKNYKQALVIQKEVNALLLEASGGLFTTKFKTRGIYRKSTQPVINSLYLSNRKKIKSPVIYFRSGADTKTLVYTAIFNTLRNVALNAKDLTSPLRIKESELTPDLAIKTLITRLVWLKLASS